MSIRAHQIFTSTPRATLPSHPLAIARSNFNNAIARSSNIVYLTRLMKWPAHYPPGCPGPDAVPATGQVWRLVRSSPPDRSDWLSFRELHPGRRRETDGGECKTCGLSVHRDPADSVRLKQRIPAYREHVLASANLTPAHGVTSPTPSKLAGASHETWWVPLVVEPWTLFVISAEVGDETP
jgi:hypothetical protein